MMIFFQAASKHQQPCVQEHVGAESLIEAYHIVTLGFSEVAKDHSNHVQDSRMFRIRTRTLIEVFFTAVPS